MHALVLMKRMRDTHAQLWGRVVFVKIFGEVNMAKIPLEVGNNCSFTKTISESDVYMFGGITTQ